MPSGEHGLKLWQLAQASEIRWQQCYAYGGHPHAGHDRSRVLKAQSQSINHLNLMPPWRQLQEQFNDSSDLVLSKAFCSLGVIMI